VQFPQPIIAVNPQSATRAINSPFSARRLFPGINSIINPATIGAAYGNPALYGVVVPQSRGAIVLSCNVVDPPPARIIPDPNVQADSLGRFVHPISTAWLNPFAGDTFTITLAICPALTVTGAALIVKLPGDVPCADVTT